MASAIEFLISQGHLFRDLKSYSLPQVLLFMNLANRRMGMSNGPVDKSQEQRVTRYRSYREAGGKKLRKQKRLR